MRTYSNNWFIIEANYLFSEIRMLANTHQNICYFIRVRSLNAKQKVQSFLVFEDYLK